MDFEFNLNKLHSFMNKDENSYNYQLVFLNNINATAFDNHLIATIDENLKINKIDKTFRRPKDLINFVDKNIDSFDLEKNELVVLSKPTNNESFEYFMFPARIFNDLNNSSLIKDFRFKTR